MIYSGVSWVMDLFNHFFHYFLFFCCPTIIFSSCLFVYILCSIICLCHRVSFYVISNDLSHFSAWRIVMSHSIPISWTLVQRSLVERVILLERVHVHHFFRVYPFHYVFSVEFICWYLEYVQVKKKKQNK